MLKTLVGLRPFAEKLFKAPVHVAVTGGAGQIAYSLLFRIASGAFLGPHQPIILHVYDLPPMQDPLSGVAMELQDCAFPTLSEVIPSDSLSTAMREAEYVFLLGAKPRGPGMERVDLLKQNGEIFVKVGEALNLHAKRTVKVLTVGNPANTNALICSHYARNIPRENFSSLTRLDHNRAVAQLANKVRVHISDVKKVAIWGNHSATMYPDVSNTLIKGRPATEVLDRSWLHDVFIPTVQNRGTEIIQARKRSSAGSCATAAIDHMRDWVLGTNGGWVSMAVATDQYNEVYGIPKGLIFSYPVICDQGHYNLVRGLALDEFSEEKIKTSTEELLNERKAVEDLLR